MAQPSRGLRRRERKNITNGVAHVNSTFNNTIITISDVQGNVISGLLLAGRGSRVRVSRRLTLRRWLQKMQAARRRSTA